MRGVTPLLPNMPSWRGAQLRHRDNFTLHLCNYSEAEWTTSNRDMRVAVCLINMMYSNLMCCNSDVSYADMLIELSTHC